MAVNYLRSSTVVHPPRAPLAPGHRPRPGRASGLWALGLTLQLLGPAAAQVAPSAEPPKARLDGAAAPPAEVDLTTPKPWRWQLGAGIPLLAVGVILTGVGGGLLADPPVTDPAGCNVMGLAGPCVFGRGKAGTIIGFGLAFGIGGAVLTGMGIRSAVQGRPSEVTSPSPMGSSTATPSLPDPTPLPAASAE